MFVCFEADFFTAHSSALCFSQSRCLWDAPPCFLLEPAVEPGPEWMALCRRSAPLHPQWQWLTTLSNNGLDNSRSCYDIMQRSHMTEKISGTKKKKVDHAFPGSEPKSETADAVTQLILWTAVNVRKGFKISLAYIGDYFSHQTGGCVSAPRDLGALVTRIQQALPNHVGGRLPLLALNWLERPEPEGRNRVAGTSSRELGE